MAVIGGSRPSAPRSGPQRLVVCRRRNPELAKHDVDQVGESGFSGRVTMRPPDRARDCRAQGVWDRLAQTDACLCRGMNARACFMVGDLVAN
jgi:hypothetical protein